MVSDIPAGDGKIANLFLQFKSRCLVLWSWIQFPRIFTQNIRTLYAILYFEVDKVVLVVFSELSFRFGLNHSVPVSITSVADPGSGAFLTPGSGIRNR